MGALLYVYIGFIIAQTFSEQMSATFIMVVVFTHIFISFVYMRINIVKDRMFLHNVQ